MAKRCCPICESNVVAIMRTGELQRPPAPGDLVLCGRCGSPLRYTADCALVEISHAELEALDTDTLTTLAVGKALIRSARILGDQERAKNAWLN